MTAWHNRFGQWCCDVWEGLPVTSRVLSADSLTLTSIVHSDNPVVPCLHLSRCEVLDAEATASEGGLRGRSPANDVAVVMVPFLD